MSDVSRVIDDLRDAATRLSFPEPPALPAFERQRAGAVPALAMVLASLLVVTLVVPVRRALADALGLGGVALQITDGVGPSQAPLDGLGDLVSLETARAAVTFPIRIPPGPEPEAVFLGDFDGPAVTLVWGPTDALRDPFGTGVGLMIMAFRGSVDRPVLTKVVGSEEAVVGVLVVGNEGLWVEGAHHVAVVGPNGPWEDALRVSGSVLIFEYLGVTYRIESALGLEATLRLAESLVSAP